MRCFIAGATGVLGRRVVPRLTADGHRVTGVARTAEKAAALRARGATPIQVNLFDPQAVRGAVDGSEVVMNLATAVPPTSRMLRRSAWRETDRLRSEASRNLVDAALATGTDLLGRRVRRLPAWLGVTGPLQLQARSQRVSNRRLREATVWRPAHPSRREGWAAVLADIRAVPAGA